MPRHETANRVHKAVLWPILRRDSHGKPILDPARVYAGIWCRAEVNLFSYDTDGNRGVSFGLNNFQRLADGRRLPDGLDRVH